MGTEGYGGGIRVFSLLLMVSGYVDLYRRKEDIGGVTGAPRGRGARPGKGGAPPPSWAPRGSSDVVLKFFVRVFSKNSSREGFIPFGLHLIFLFCKTLKQAKNSNLDWAFGLVG